MGIITKPDLMNKGPQKRIALLAKNEDTTKLKPGFFLVKNPTRSELESETAPEHYLHAAAKPAEWQPSRDE